MDFENASEICKLESRVRELEAERDRLIENISTLLAQRKEAQHKSIAAMMEVAELRARHAALVKLVTKIAQPISCGCNPCTGDCVSQNALQIYLDEIKAECKAALAEVKK